MNPCIVVKDEGLCPESFSLNDEGLCPESYYSNCRGLMPWELAPNVEGLCPESFALNDEGSCPESYYSNMLRDYALIGTTCILKSLSLHLSSVVSSLMHYRHCRVVNELLRG